MRILVLADIHANWEALSSIDEEFDECLVVGDLVDYGTWPAPCVDWVRENATACVRGNHDHAVAQRIEARGTSGFRSLAAATRELNRAALDREQLEFLARLPVTQYVELGGLTFFLVHATPRDPLDEYLTDDIDGWSDRLKQVDADFVCVGHTHVPFHLELDGIQVVNPGSVGQPRDGDPRLSYAIIEDGTVTFERATYDVESALDQSRESGLSGEPLELATAVLRTGGRPSSVS